MKRLRITDASGEREVLLAGSIVVGRDPVCDISDPDTRLSRQHAEFSAAQDGVSVRDLNSRNGIQVNGVTTKQALLLPGDVVQVAGMRIEYLDDEGTAPPAPPAAPRAASAGPPARASSSPASGGNQDGKTMMQPPLQPVASSQPSRGRPEPPRAAPHSRERHGIGSWALRVRLSFLAVALVVYAGTLVPGLLTRNGVLEATAESRATALAHWLAAEAARPLDAGATASASADSVREEPGVVAARVLNLQGGVLAPAVEADQAYKSIPVINLAPEAVRTLRTAWNADLVEVATPVMTRQGRVAVAWLTFRSSEPPGGVSVLIPVVVPFMIALGCALLFARAVHRHVATGLRRFNDDIESATRGDLQEVVDPLGIDVLRDVAGSVNYLVDRFKSAGLVMQAQPVRERQTAQGYVPAAASQPARPRGGSPTAESSTTQPQTGAWLVASDQLRIVEAGSDLTGIVADPARVIGKHLVDAIKDTVLVDAMLGCLGKVQPGGTERTSVTLADGSPPVQVVVEKQADRRVRVSFVGHSKG